MWTPIYYAIGKAVGYTCESHRQLYRNLAIVAKVTAGEKDGLRRNLKANYQALVWGA